MCSVTATEERGGHGDDFYRTITQGTEPGTSGRSNLKTIAMYEMLARSARERRPVEATELV